MKKEKLLEIKAKVDDGLALREDKGGLGLDLEDIGPMLKINQLTMSLLLALCFVNGRFKINFVTLFRGLGKIRAFLKEVKSLVLEIKTN